MKSKETIFEDLIRVFPIVIEYFIENYMERDLCLSKS